MVCFKSQIYVTLIAFLWSLHLKTDLGEVPAEISYL